MSAPVTPRPRSGTRKGSQRTRTPTSTARRVRRWKDVTWTPEMRAEAAAFERKTVFITIDAPAPGGRDRELRQFVGEIVAFTANGVFLRLLDGRGVVLPPDLAAFSWADAGTYRLSGIAACVADPDVVTAWVNHDDGALSRIKPPPPLGDEEWDGTIRLVVAPNSDPTDGSFDPLRARALTGKSIIIGIRYVDAAGNEVEARRFYGRIRSFTDKEATVALQEGTYLSLPPTPHHF